MESAKIIGKVARMLGNVGAAEEIAQDTWIAALEQWIECGVPENPGAWLITTAKNRAIDEIRRRQLIERKNEVMAHDPDLLGGAELAESFPADEVADDCSRAFAAICSSGSAASRKHERSSRTRPP